VLLRHFLWNAEKLLQSFSDDPQRTCKQAGITLGNPKVRPSYVDDSHEVCEIYYENKKRCDGLMMSCEDYWNWKVFRAKDH
jgi:hypothetical protein